MPLIRMLAGDRLKRLIYVPESALRTRQSSGPHIEMIHAPRVIMQLDEYRMIHL